MTAFKSKPQTTLNVRVPQEVKAELEVKAAAENLTLADYIRRHFQELLWAQRINVDSDTRVKVPNYWYPYTPQSGQPPFPPSPFGYSPPYPQSYPPNYPAPPSTSTDRMLESMRKFVELKMMKELFGGGSTPEAFLAAARKGWIPDKPEKDEFSFDKLMRYQMWQQNMDREMYRAQQQMELARRKGDAGEEKRAQDTLTNLMALSMQQNQAFLQQYMASQQQSNTAQQTLFTTALQSSRQADADAARSRSDMDVKLEGMRNQFWTGQLSNIQTLNALRVDNLMKEMERIRTEGGLTNQISKMVELRKDPVYKAAFDAAFGIKDETMIGKLIPQLKELGIDQFIGKVGGYLTGLIAKPPSIPTPPPATMPAPAPATLPAPLPPGAAPPPSTAPPTGVPSPFPTPALGTPLEALSLPAQSTQQLPQPVQPATPPKPLEFQAIPMAPPEVFTPKQPKQNVQALPPEATGYTNLDKSPTDNLVQIPMQITAEEPAETVAIPLPPPPNETGETNTE